MAGEILDHTINQWLRTCHLKQHWWKLVSGKAEARSLWQHEKKGHAQRIVFVLRFGKL